MSMADAIHNVAGAALLAVLAIGAVHYEHILLGIGAVGVYLCWGWRS